MIGETDASSCSPLAEKAFEFAREILGARATEDEGLLIRTISLVMANMVVEPDLFPLILGAQAYLTWAALSAAAVEVLGPGATDEEMDGEVRRRLEALFMGVTVAGPSL